MEPTPITEGRKGLIERALSIMAEVKAGEGLTALLLAFNVFLLLASYYVLKTVREPLILAESGAVVKSYAAAGQAALLLLVVPAYGMIAARINRIRLISWVTLFFIANLAIFYLFGVGGADIGVVFFVWVGIFNVLVIAQFWAFANDVYTEEQGKRLFAIVGIGATLGAWMGSKAAEGLFASLNPETAPYDMLLIAGAGLGGCIGISHIVHRRETAVRDVERADEAVKPLEQIGGFKLVLSQRYLLLIAILILLLNTVNTLGEFILGSVVTADVQQRVADEAQQKQLIGQFYGDFFAWVNLLAFLFQSFLVSRLFKWIGVRGALFILPCIALGSYSLIVALPVLSIIRVAKILENSTDYSINNTARHALFLPTSREAKYKAKAAIDTFFWRAGDLLQAGVVFAGTQLVFGAAQFGLVNLMLALVWLGVVAAIAKEHRKLSAERPLAKAA